MSTFQQYLDNSLCINMWENGVTDVEDFAVVGNKSDGTASYILLSLPAIPPAGAVVASGATLRLAEMDYPNYRGATALTAKISRITGAFDANSKWNTCPAYDSAVFTSHVLNNAAPGNGNSNYIVTTHHATRYKYTSGSLVAYYDTYQGDRFLIGDRLYVYDSTIPAHDTYAYYLYHTIDITTQLQDAIDHGATGLIIWFDTPGPNSSRKYFKSPLTSDINLQPRIDATYTMLSAPTISISNASPYEGESVTITCGRPSEYNALDHLGAVNSLHYYVELEDGTTLCDGSRLVNASPSSLALTYVVGNLTTGLVDRSTNIRVRCVDADGRVSAYSSNLAVTIKRFRAPVLNISSPARTGDTTATIGFVIQDTGYGGTQAGTQISAGTGKVEYKIDSGAYATATLGSWTGLTNSFNITGLSAGRHTLYVRAKNDKPAALADGLTGNADTRTLLEPSPSVFFYRDSADGKSGIDIDSIPLAKADGWIALPAMTRETNNSFSCAIDLTEATVGYIKKGTKIRYKQGGTWKYQSVLSVGTYSGGKTIITTTGGSDFNFTAGTAITDGYFSNIENPAGFPDGFNLTAPTWTASGTAFTVQPDVGAFKIRIVNNTARLYGTAHMNTSGTGTNIFTATFDSAQIPTTSVDFTGCGKNTTSTYTVTPYMQWNGSATYRFMLTKYDGTTPAANNQYINIDITWSF